MRLRRFALLVGFVPLVTACPPPDPGTTTTTSAPSSTTTTSSTTSTSTATTTSTSTTTSTTSTSTTSTTTTTVPSGPINRQVRASVQSAYNNRLVPALAVPTGWTGSVAGCNAGTTSAAHQTATLDTVNFFREFVGLTNVSFNATYSAKAQQAALMMQANNQLSHNPPTSWTCYTADGAQAAGSSNIALGTNNGPNAVRLYMIDPGSGNTAAGHRRWVLDPTRLTMGSGTTGNANDLWVFGATQPLPAWSLVAVDPERELLCRSHHGDRQPRHELPDHEAARGERLRTEHRGVAGGQPDVRRRPGRPQLHRHGQRHHRLDLHELQLRREDVRRRLIGDPLVIP